MILAIGYPDREPVETALKRPARAQGKAGTEAVLARFLTGRILHHVTLVHDFGAS
jgi:hypothetical protein